MSKPGWADSHYRTLETLNNPLNKPPHKHGHRTATRKHRDSQAPRLTRLSHDNEFALEIIMLSKQRPRNKNAKTNTPKKKNAQKNEPKK